MKKALPVLTFLFVFLFIASSVSHAQFRDQKPKQSEYSGPIMKKDDPSDGANLGNLFNMKMTHSYSMNFASMGGQMMNVNAYVNSMNFFFNEDLTGQVNVALLHSPFGQSNFYNLNQENSFDLNVALNAQLDYEINERMSLHFEVSQVPGGYGYGSPYSGSYRSSPFQYGPIFQ